MSLPRTPGAVPEPLNQDESAKVLPTAPGQKPNWRKQMKSLEEHVGEAEDTPKLGVPVNAPAQESTDTYVHVGQMSAQELLDAKDDILVNLRGIIAEVVEWVQNRLREEQLTDDLAAARAQGGATRARVGQRIDSLLLQHMSERRDIPPGKERSYIIASVINEIIGLGPLEPLWGDPSITEIMVNGPYDVQVEINGQIQRVPGIKFRDQDHLLDLCTQILNGIGRSITVRNPIEDGRLPDNSRVHVVHQAIAPKGPNLTIRRHREDAWTVRELVNRGSFTEEMAADIAFYIHSGCSTIVVGGTGTGKDLALDTKIPTPTGMTTMGDLKVGDQVLDEHGKPTNVVGVYPQPLNKCYEITFSDGTKVTAGKDHNWLTTTVEGGVSKVVTTEEILETLKTSDGQPNHLVGLISQEVEYPSQRASRVSAYNFGRNISQASHIPHAYMYTDVKSRRHLILGMIDSDDITGKYSFETNNEQVMNDARQVAHSLGVQTQVREYSTPGTYVVTFLLQSETMHAPRKIVNVREVPSVPTQCIEVDSPSHLFLCTDAFIPTHNTTVLNALSGLTPFNERIITIEDNLELMLHPDRLAAAPMEARPASSSGQGAITIRDLVKGSLRMRPNRIIVGEVRDHAAFDMLQAMNTGHNGSMTTIHANGADEAIPRLVNLVTQSGEINENGALSLIAGAVDILVVAVRFPEDGSRRLQGVYEVPSRTHADDSGARVLEPIPLWEFEQDSIDPETGKVIGHYERKNEPSDGLIRKHRLHRRDKFTLEQVYELSDIPEGA